MTPRTDAFQATLTVARKDTKETIGELQRTLDHARQLETELSAPTAALAAAIDGLNHIRGLVTNESSLTYDEIMEHIEKHADIALAASNPNHP